MSEKIPKEWKWVKLGEVAEIKTGKTNSQDANNTGDYPLFDRSSVIKRSKKFLFDTEAVIVPGEGKEFIPRYYNGKFDLHQRAYAIFNFKRCISKFIYYNVLLNKDIFKSFATGSTVLSLRLEHFLNFPILLPPLHEQKAIAEVLSSIDDKIDLLHRQNKTLEEMAMTLFRQWFIEPTKDGLPEGWEEVSLGEIIEISSGKSIEKGKLKEKGLYPVLGANGEIGRTDDWLYEGELIYTGRVGTLGNVFIVFRNEKVWLTDNTLVIKPNKNEYFYFVYFTLKNAKLDEYNSGSTQPLIRQSDIKKIEIFLPKINFLKDFEVISRNLFTKIQFDTSQIQTLDKLRDTLLPKLMSGELRVKV